MKKSTYIQKRQARQANPRPVRATRVNAGRLREATRASKPGPRARLLRAPSEVVLAENEPAAPRAPESGQLDALQLYFREIGRVKLLTPEEEVILAKRIKRGDEAAREQMIKANLRLVVKIARDYEGLGLPVLDLINEGNIGLIKGVERFNPAKGAKLSTYAAWWIKQAIKRALANQSKTIRLPVHVIDKTAHIRRAEMRLRETLDRDPTHEEVAAEVGIPAQRVREYLEAARAPVPLDAPLGSDEESNRISETVADANAAAPFDHVVQASDTELAREVMATLSPREHAILSLRFGLTDDSPKTLEVIGRRFGVTRERIRQIESEALRKLRRKMEKRDQPAIEGITALTE